MNSRWVRGRYNTTSRNYGLCTGSVFWQSGGYAAFVNNIQLNKNEPFRDISTAQDACDAFVLKKAQGLVAMFSADSTEEQPWL